MNFLAHLLLAGNDEELIAGNFIADSVKGNKINDYPEGIRKGIRMHRKVDFFSDNHPVYLRSVHRLQPFNGKYSGVITDMFYDYFLANEWARFSSVSLEQFISGAYGILNSFTAIMPEESRVILTYMVKYNWLYTYKSLAGLEKALAGMSKRMKYYFPMNMAVAELEKNPSPYRDDFLEFFPLLIQEQNNFNL